MPTRTTHAQEAYTRSDCPKTIGPTTGRSCSDLGKIAWNWCFAGEPASCRSFARYDESPTAPAKLVRARPETIWFARRVTTRNAWIAAIAAPARAAIPTAATSTTADAP